MLVPRQIVNIETTFTQYCIFPRVFSNAESSVHEAFRKLGHVPLEDGTKNIWHSNWLLSVDYNKGLRSDHQCDLGIEDQSQIYLESICLMAGNTNSSFML